MADTIQFRHETTAEVTPQELGRLFAMMDDHQQADFFEAVAKELEPAKFGSLQPHYIGDRLCERGCHSPAWQFVASLCSSVMVHAWRGTVNNKWPYP